MLTRSAKSARILSRPQVSESLKFVSRKSGPSLITIRTIACIKPGQSYLNNKGSEKFSLLYHSAINSSQPYDRLRRKSIKQCWRSSSRHSSTMGASHREVLPDMYEGSSLDEYSPAG